MYSYNITFVTAPDAGERFIEWLRASALPVLMNPEYGACNPRLQTVVEAGGEKPGPDHGLSMALCLEFSSEEKAHVWHDALLPGVLGDFNRKFGPHAAFFVTLLNTLLL
ncbi:MAG: DUF4286 family protein [Muribaculaceae bacterium]|nr:DUF4286 family protein [Muribaculaceae bacterium]MDE5714410.1 DUF4286 family protein [Muribaculaceae bacterium]